MPNHLRDDSNASKISVFLPIDLVDWLTLCARENRCNIDYVLTRLIDGAREHYMSTATPPSEICQIALPPPTKIRGNGKEKTQ